MASGCCRLNLSHRAQDTSTETFSEADLNILLVDDSDDMRRLVELFIKMMGHEVGIAENGEDAVKAFKAGSYDAVLMDMRMPGIDGCEATRRIRAHEKENGLEGTPIIALTAFSTKEEIDKSLEAGCNAHLVKPVSKNSLGETLDNLGQYKTVSVADGAEEKDSADGEKIRVAIDPDLEDLIPSYLSKRQQDLERLDGFLAEKNFEEIRSIGHKIKGSGGGYGFAGLSEIGMSIEEAAKAQEAAKIESSVAEMKDYLSRLDIVYEE
jgi:CheY-like chemotaxis protein